MSSREVILGRVRRAIADVRQDDTPYEQAVDRRYLREHGARSVAETVDLLAENLADYRALVHRCAALGRLPSHPSSRASQLRLQLAERRRA